jgi:hypothetical protein
VALLLKEVCPLLAGIITRFLSISSIAFRLLCLATAFGAVRATFMALLPTQRQQACQPEDLLVNCWTRGARACFVALLLCGRRTLICVGAWRLQLPSWLYCYQKESLNASQNTGGSVSRAPFVTLLFKYGRQLTCFDHMQDISARPPFVPSRFGHGAHEAIIVAVEAESS